MLNKIKNWFINLVIDHDDCFEKMLSDGNAAVNMCAGITSDDSKNDYVEAKCKGCNYYVKIRAHNIDE